MRRRRIPGALGRAAALVGLALAGFAVAFAVAGGTPRALAQVDTTEVVTETETETVTQTETETVTETETETVGETETQTVTETETVTTESTETADTTETAGAESSSDDGIPGWVWVVLAVAGAVVVGLLAWLLGRRGGSAAIETRRRQLNAAVGSWVAQGWAVESQTDASAVLARAGERVVVAVDAQGNVTSGPLGAAPPPYSSPGP